MPQSEDDRLNNRVIMVAERGKQRTYGLIKKHPIMPAELCQHVGADGTFHWVVAGEELYASAKFCLAAAIVHGRKQCGRVVSALTFHVGRYDFICRSSIECTRIPGVPSSLRDDRGSPVRFGVGVSVCGS